MFLHNSIILNFQIFVKGHVVYEIIKELISKGESTTPGLLIGGGGGGPVLKQPCNGGDGEGWVGNKNMY